MLNQHGAKTDLSDLRDRLYASLRTVSRSYVGSSLHRSARQLPLAGSRKANRAALPAPILLRGWAYAWLHVAPTTRLQSQLTAVWGQVLGQHASRWMPTSSPNWAPTRC